MSEAKQDGRETKFIKNPLQPLFHSELWTFLDCALQVPASGTRRIPKGPQPAPGSHPPERKGGLAPDLRQPNWVLLNGSPNVCVRTLKFIPYDLEIVAPI